MIELKKAIKKVLEELKEKYKNGNRKALSEILSLIKKDVFDLLNQGLSIKMTKKIVENAIELKIKDDTFYKWVKREKEKTPVVDNQLKNYRLSPAREKEKDVSSSIPAPVSISQKPKKEVQQDEKSEVKEKKKVNPAEILNSDIFATDSEYKNLL